MPLQTTIRLEGCADGVQLHQYNPKIIKMYSGTQLYIVLAVKCCCRHVFFENVDHLAGLLPIHDTELASIAL